MADKTQTKDQTKDAPKAAPMQEPGMPAGQAPATQGARQREAPMSPNARAAEVRSTRMGQMVSAIENNRPTIDPVLKAQGIPFEVFRAAAIVGLKNTLRNDRDFFEKVSVASFFEAIQRAAKDGLMPDGKQCAIARFAEDAAYMPMIEGYVKILTDTGMVQSINHGLVLESDTFEFELGSDPWVRHIPDLESDPESPDAKVRAAWCLVKTVNGGTYVEVTPRATLERIAKVSRSAKGPRSAWGGEMHRKAPFRRLLKRLPHHPKLAQLAEHEDMNVDLEKPVADTPQERRHAAARQLGDSELFADTRAALPAPDESMVMDSIDGAAPADAEDADIEDQTEAVAAIAAAGAAEDMSALAAARLAWTENPAREEASKETENWVQEAFDRRAEELTEGAPAREGPRPLRALTSSTQKEAKVYEDPRLWLGDILMKLSAIAQHEAKGFWKKNADFIREAKEDGVAEADKVLAALVEKGVHVDANDHSNG